VLALAGAGGYFAWQKSKGAATTDDLEAKKRIAVMYFEDRSPGKDLGHVADGITESLINELSAVKDLRVISRNGVAPFKGQPATSTVAEQLGGVGTFVTGSISPAAEGKIRVALQLVDAKTNEQLQETRIDQPKDKLLELQDSIAVKMSLFLRGHVGKELKDLVSRAGTNNAGAWDAMQRARVTMSEIDALIRARQVPAAFQKITESDEALAKVEAADGNWRDPVVERAWLAYRAARLIPPSDPNLLKTIEGGLAHAERALKMSASDTSAIEARGTLTYWKWLNNLAKSESEAASLFSVAEKDLAVAMADVRRASANNTYSHLLLNKGEIAEAQIAAGRAYESDPYLTDVDRTLHRLVTTSLDLENRGEAAKWCEVGQARFPDNYRFSECQLWLYAMPALEPPNITEAWAKYDEVVKKSPETVKRFIGLKGKMIMALALVRANQLDSAKSLAESSQGDKVLDPRGELTNLAVIVYAQSGDKDTALDLFARYLAANPAQRAFAAKDQAWWLRDLRADPRWKRLVGAGN
jgi:TolB-like protein